MSHAEVTLNVPPEDLIAAIPSACKDYVNGHDPDSFPTCVALVLLEKLPEDLRKDRPQSEWGYGRTELIDIARKRYEAAGHQLPSWDTQKTIGRALGDQFKKFLSEPIGSIRLRFDGPPRAYRDGRGSNRYYLTPIAVHEPNAPLTFPNLQGKCFWCPETSSPFNPSKRRCPNPACDSNKFQPDDDRQPYLTIFPEPTFETPPSPDVVQHLIPALTIDEAAVTPTPGEADAHVWKVPYRRDYLADLGLSLGTPLVYRAPQLEAWTQFGRVYVLDMSTYSWSHTLKDPKSWLVANLAIERRLHSLITYTAGNAGLSLAKIIYEVNRRTNHDITVYTLLDDSVPIAIQEALASSGAEIMPIGWNRPIQAVVPKQIWRVMNSRLFKRSSDAPTPGAWIVSDGFDGMGILGYRSLFAYILKLLHINYMVVPLGTGNLFLGAAQGLQDARSTHTCLVGALPLGENSLPADLKADQDGPPLDERERPVAPKLTGCYTPLKRCIYKIGTSYNAKFIQVSGRMQHAAYVRLLQQPTIAAEPSATIAFGALCGADERRGLLEIVSASDSERDAVAESSVLVVNSGRGVFGDDELRLLKKKGDVD
jgi:threonine dehydratase